MQLLQSARFHGYARPAFDSSQEKSRSLTDSRKARGDGYANLTKDLQIDTPFQVLSSDISYIRTGEGFDYLCQIQDVKSGIILEESMSDHMKAEVVV